jgi:hypothetical protein
LHFERGRKKQQMALPIVEKPPKYNLQYTKASGDECCGKAMDECQEMGHKSIYVADVVLHFNFVLLLFDANI